MQLESLGSRGPSVSLVVKEIVGPPVLQVPLVMSAVLVLLVRGEGEEGRDRVGVGGEWVVRSLGWTIENGGGVGS